MFETVLDNVTLELRADDVQPSRFNWTIRVATMLDNSAPGNGLSGVGKKGPPPGGPRLSHPPELNYRFPIFILGFVVVSVVVFLLCRKSKNDKKRQLAEDNIPNIGTRELPEIDEEIRRSKVLQPGPARRGNDLLDITVYATSTQQGQPSVSFMQQPPLSSCIKATTFESEDVEPKPSNKPVLGPAYRSTALSAVTAAAQQSKNSTGQKPTGASLSSRLNENQYWV